MKYVAEIPVRLGSKRVPRKNLRLINGKPMVAYAIEAARQSEKVGAVYVNSEGEVMKRLCTELGVNFYERKPELLEDHVVQDQFNFDFLSNIETENLVMVNPVSPLVLPSDIDAAIDYYEKKHLDCLISVREEKLQTFFNGKPLNFSDKALLPMTQTLVPVQLCAWTVCIWNAALFLEQFRKNGFAVFIGNYGLYPFDSIRSIKVSTEEDFRLAELYLKARSTGSAEEVRFYE